MKLYPIMCDAPGLPLFTGSSFMPNAEWRIDERLIAIRTRGGAIVAPKQLSFQGTALHLVRPVNADFPYSHVRAGAQDLT